MKVYIIYKYGQNGLALPVDLNLRYINVKSPEKSLDVLEKT